MCKGYTKKGEDLSRERDIESILYSKSVNVENSCEAVCGQTEEDAIQLLYLAPHPLSVTLAQG